ncbi:GNAT family N-acetyltransferase [Clostridium perfringens]|uniref:GNAT family N-acetyltransferase n=1 Tax=Clostridium perfringens TaxID=1502 RepID=UPI000E0AC416|nr:hypothetical protein C8114_03710 [Clostridium perfringens]
MPRNKYPEETVQKILDASLKLFLEKGYEETTVLDIISEMGGLTRGAFYHHFKSKEEVFDALCEKLFYETNPFKKAKNHKELNGLEKLKFIAKENNKIIGFAYCYTLLRPDGKTMFYLHSIGMLPNYQDKGYGSKLLSFIKEYSKEIGCSEMFLITDKGNPRACHVYEKLGGKNDYKDEIVYVYDYEKGDK